MGFWGLGVWVRGFGVGSVESVELEEEEEKRKKIKNEGKKELAFIPSGGSSSHLVMGKSHLIIFLL